MISLLLINIYLLIAITLTGYFFFYLPGYIINKQLLKNDPNFIISLIFGYSFFSLLSYFIYYLELQISTTLYFIIIFYLLFIFFFKNSFNLINKDFFKILKKNYLYILVILSLFLALFSKYFIYFNHTGSDTWSLMSIVRSFLDDGYFSNISPWFDSIQSAYPSNTFLLYLTLIKFLSFKSISLADLFNVVGIYLIIIIILINILVLNYFIKHLLKSTSIILIIFYLSFKIDSGLISLIQDYPFYPKIFSPLIYIPSLIYIFFSNLYKKKYFPFVLFVIFLSFINHSSLNLILLSILIFGFILVDIKVSNLLLKLKNILIPFLFIVLFVSFYLLDFYKTPNGTVTTYTNDLSLNKSLLKVYYYIYNPEKFFEYYSTFYLILLVLIIFVLKKIIQDNIFRYHVILATISVLILFNPASIYLINQFMPLYFLYRINFIFSNFFLMGIVLFILSNKYRFKENFFKFLLISSISLNIGIFSLNITHSQKNLVKNYKDFEIFLNKNINKNSFIVSDGNSSTKILSFRKLKVLTFSEDFLTAVTPKKNFLIYQKIYDLKNNIKDPGLENYLRLIGANYFIINKIYSKNFAIIKPTQNMKKIFENDIYIVFKLF